MCKNSVMRAAFYRHDILSDMAAACVGRFLFCFCATYREMWLIFVLFLYYISIELKTQFTVLPGAFDHNCCIVCVLGGGGWLFANVVYLIICTSGLCLPCVCLNVCLFAR